MAAAALCWDVQRSGAHMLYSDLTSCIWLHHRVPVGSCVARPVSSLCTCACQRISSSPNSFLCSIEMNMSYIYHAIYNYFSRDNVALPGLAKYFLDESHAEREHAQMLMDFQVRLS